MPNCHRALLSFAALLLPLPALAHQVVKIADGDTLTLLVERKQVKIRIHGIDAPEKRQPFYRRSGQSLSELCWGKDATFEKTGRSWDRLTAHLHCDGVNVGTAQVAKGFAWVEPRFNKDLALPPLQERARAEKRGLWVDPEPVAPWEWRKTR
jgi:micrococcal nuclease